VMNERRKTCRRFGLLDVEDANGAAGAARANLALDLHVELLVSVDVLDRTSRV
jgi:hypothetical protein